MAIFYPHIKIKVFGFGFIGLTLKNFHQIFTYPLVRSTHLLYTSIKLKAVLGLIRSARLAS